MTSITTTRNSRQPGIATTYNPIAGAPVTGDSFPSGTPVFQSLLVDGTVLPGNATSIDTACLVGLAAAAGFQGRNVFVQYAGPLELTTEQWDAVISGPPGGLVRGVPYYLAANFSQSRGRITATQPGSGLVRIQVGIALSSTEMQVLLGAAIVNP